MNVLSPSITAAGPALEPQAHTLAARFAAVVESFGDRTALTFGAESMTYAELDRSAQRVATSLAALNISSDSLVAIHLDRSIEMIVAMLGVIKAGAAYLPLDPNYPESRIRETITDAQPMAVISDAIRLPRLEGACNHLFNVSDLIQSRDTLTSSVSASPHSLAYVIYTSGSTGKPKGVMVTQENVLRLLDRTNHWYGFNQHDIWTMFHSFAFDFSVWEIWGALLYGGRLVIVPYALSRSPEEFYALLADERVTVLNQTPTAFSLLMQAEARLQPRDLALRYVIFGGEALNLRSLLPWFERHGDATPQLINMYGITETTVHVTYRRIFAKEAATENESLIGEPIPDLRIELLDDNLQPVAPGEAGEICIGGPGVARGYLNRDELTAQRFIPDPLSFTGARLYRSGDLARQRPDGELVYLGRADRQVKINGFRIELGEIEAVLTSCAGVAQACVVPHSDNAGQRLAAYYVTAGAAIEEPALRAFAEAHLPTHMRPAFYRHMEALPINGNGKIDRAALPSPATPFKSPAAAADLSSGNKLEQQIAAIWCQVLKVETIGLDDNFFDAGGSSLLLIALRGELQSALNTSIPVTWLFECTTVRTLAARMESQTAPQPSAAPQVAAELNTRAQQQRNSFARMKALRGAAR